MSPLQAKFQQRLSLNEFLEHYGTEDQCFDALYRWRWPNGFRCPHCGHDRSCVLAHRSLQQCNRCRRQTSVTAGTVFDSTKLPLTSWFLGLYLMTHERKGASAMALHRHLGISYNAAWRMRRKLISLMSDRNRPLLLVKGGEVDDAGSDVPEGETGVTDDPSEATPPAAGAGLDEGDPPAD